MNDISDNVVLLTLSGIDPILSIFSQRYDQQALIST